MVRCQGGDVERRGECSLLSVRERGGGNWGSRPPECTGRSERSGDTDEPLRVRRPERGCHLWWAQRAIDQHRNGTCAPHAIHGDGQVNSGRNHHRHAIAAVHPSPDEARGRRVDPSVEVREGDRSAITGHFDDCGDFCSVRVCYRIEQGRRCVQVGIIVTRGDGRQIVEPRGNGVMDRRIFGNEVASVGPAVHIGVRKPGFEVVEVEVGEHRVFGAPQQQGGHIGEFAQPGRDAVERGPTRMVVL